MSGSRVKAGTSKRAAAERRKIFVQAYIANGRNGSKAAIMAGFSQNGAEVAASRMLKDANVQEMLALAEEKLAQKSGLTAERVLAELQKIVFSDTRNLYNLDGSLKAPHEWDDDTAAMVAGVKVTEEFEGKGEKRELVGYTKEVKQWDKLAAIDKAMKHLGLFKEDNAQKAPNLVLQIANVGPV